MRSFKSAKIYHERLVDFTNFAARQLPVVSLELTLVHYFRLKKEELDESGKFKYRATTLRSWLSVFCKFWLHCRETPNLKGKVPILELEIGK